MPVAKKSGFEGIKGKHTANRNGRKREGRGDATCLHREGHEVQNKKFLSNLVRKVEPRALMRPH